MAIDHLSNGSAIVEGSSIVAQRFIERFENWVTLRPNQIAIADSTQQFTYLQLSGRMHDLADLMRSHGVQSGHHVGLAMRRSVAAVETILALQKIGAAYVPLDPTLPDDRLRSILEDARLRIALVDDFGDDRLKRITSRGTPLTVLSIGERPTPAPVGRSHPETPGCLAASPLEGTAADWSMAEHPRGTTTDLAYIIFTSGSTGRPKGVPIDQTNLAHLLQAWDEIMGANRRVSLLLSALSFDASVAELFWPLASGNTLVVATAMTSNLEVGLPKLVEQHGVNHLQITPTRATLILANESDRSALCEIEHLVIGGEAVPERLADELLRAGVKRVTNAYGPTEATVWATSIDLVPERERRGAVAPIGRPLPGVVAKVINASGETVLLGEQGELVLGGPFVASGYLAQPERSADRFQTFEFGDSLLHGYRTGDLVAQRSDGTFDFFGRSDHQVKIRGHRIELGEIEALLSSDVSVSQSAVCVDPHRPNQLVAFVSPNGEMLVGDLELRLRRRLPEVMIPSRWVVLEQLPQSTSAKVDRLALLSSLTAETASAHFTLACGPDRHISHLAQTSAEFSPAQSSSSPITDGSASLITQGSAGPSVAAANPPVIDAQLVADEMALVLLRTVPLDGDFFAFGGHSMAAVELIERLHARTQIRLPLTALLEASTPAEVADRLNAPPIETGGPEVLVRLGRGRELDPKAARDAQRSKLFLIHGAGGHVLRFRGLAAALRSEIEVVGVKAVGLDDGFPPDEDLPTMVDRYAHAIADAAGSRPIHVGGYSVGGIISIHVASRLLALGANVRSLVFIDSFESNELAANTQQRLAALRSNLLVRSGRPTRIEMQDAVTGWRRRAEWDRAGLEAVSRLGFRDIYDHLSSVVLEAGAPPPVELAALLVRSSIENPLRTRSYTYAEDCPAVVTQRWIRAKHDELLTGPTIPAIAEHVFEFLSSLEALSNRQRIRRS